MSQKLTLVTKCPICGIVEHVIVDKDELKKWEDGELIQRAMPSLSADDRERLMSGICPSCFNKMEDYETQE